MHWADIPWHPSPRLLRQFAALCLVVFGAAALWQGAHQRLLIAWVLALGAAWGALGLIWPKSIRGLFIAWSVLAFPMGWLILNLCLASVFFGLVTPLAIVFRLVGRDALKRQRLPGATSYLEPKPSAPVSRYYRTF